MREINHSLINYVEFSSIQYILALFPHFLEVTEVPLFKEPKNKFHSGKRFQ